jgi:hypothetical protein
VNGPDFVANLHRVDDAKGISAQGQRDLKDAGAESLERLGNIGFAIFPAIVKAVRQMRCASTGNFSKSLRAALIHEMGRVFLVICILPAPQSQCSHI